jgi:hypothetical protein
MKSVITADWHYIEHETLGVELYRRDHDPAELSNLAKTPEGVDVSQKLARFLARAGS